MWENYESLFLFFKEASKSSSWSKAENATFSGMLTRMESPDFLLDLGLMYDVLFELSSLSLNLQHRDCNILKAERFISFTLEVIDEFKSKPGTKLLEAKVAETEGKFKSIELRANSRHVAIDSEKFLDSLRKNLDIRLNSTAYTKNSTSEIHKANTKEYETLIQSFCVLEAKEWPLPRVLSFGVQEIRYLSERFGFDPSEAVNEFRGYLNKTVDSVSKTLFGLLNVLNLIPISSAECERGFSQMNLVCTKMRNRLLVVNVASLLFIKLNGPTLERFNPLSYVQKWLADKHQSADSNRNTNHPANDHDDDGTADDIQDEHYCSIFD